MFPCVKSFVVMCVVWLLCCGVLVIGMVMTSFPGGVAMMMAGLFFLSVWFENGIESMTTSPFL